MNRKILTIILLAVVLVAGLYYVTTLKDGNENNSDISNVDNVSDNVDNESENKDVVEKDIDVDDEENIDEDNTNVDNTDTDENSIEPDIAVGELAPDFTLLNLDGEEVSLSDYRGQYVLINFWATWCKYCDIEMPDLNKLNEENEDLVVLAVNVMEDENTVDDYIKEGGYSFPVVLDKEGEIAITYLVSAFPTSFFIDKEGILLGGVPGMMTYAQMNQILDGIREDE